jgi:SNF family Na+-dependent transporter
LGSIWKFPYEVGQNGGAAFVLFYIAGLVLAVIPLMLAEFAIGRRGGGDAASSIDRVAAAHGAHRGWMAAGLLGVASGVLVLSFYSVIGGWTIAYAVDPWLPYEALLADPGRMSAYHALFLALTAVALWSVGADTAISLLAGFAVFPLVFANGLDPASGPGLVFVTLPVAFARMPFGGLAAVAFFSLLAAAALASAISMLELAVALLVRRYGWRRAPAAALVAAGCFVAGLATVFSFNRWSHWSPTPYELIDHLTSNLLLPIGGLAIALFAGWALPASVLSDELRLAPRGAARLRWLLRWAAPALIAVTALAPAVLR